MRVVKFVLFALFLMACLRSCSSAATKFTVTGYSAGDHRQGTGWRTAIGRHASHPGVAVDPHVIPLGSRVRIGHWWYVADDVGGRVKGRHIDLRFTFRGRAIQWGRKKLTVTWVDKRHSLGRQFNAGNNKEKTWLWKFQNLHRWEPLSIRSFRNWRCLPYRYSPEQKIFDEQKTFINCRGLVYGSRDLL